MGFEYPVRLRSVEDVVRRLHGSDRSLSVSEIRILSTATDEILSEIVDAWPVDTSTSRDAFEVDLHTGPGDYGFTITNDVDYAEYVHPKGTPPEPPLWKTLIPSIVGQWGPVIVAKLVSEIPRTEARINRQPNARARANALAVI
jgi:hypothetical protein